MRRGIKKVIDAIKEGFAGAELKAEMADLQTRKEALLAQLAAADEPPPLLHPRMADVYRTKVAELAVALQQPETRLEASDTLRGLIEAIVLTPESPAQNAATSAQGRCQGTDAQNRAERESGRDVDCCPTNEKVARFRRPSHAGSIGCGGPQPTVFGVLPDSGLDLAPFSPVA